MLIGKSTGEMLMMIERQSFSVGMMGVLCAQSFTGLSLHVFW